MSNEICLVVWIDATATASWLEKDDESLKPHYCSSVGYLIKETDTYITLACTISESQCNAAMSIPKPWIITRKFICPAQEE